MKRFCCLLTFAVCCRASTGNGHFLIEFGAAMSASSGAKRLSVCVTRTVN